MVCLNIDRQSVYQIIHSHFTNIVIHIQFIHSHASAKSRIHAPPGESSSPVRTRSGLFRRTLREKKTPLHCIIFYPAIQTSSAVALSLVYSHLHAPVLTPFTND